MLSKRELIDKILQLMDTIEKQNEMIEKLESLFKQYDNFNTPSSKKRFKKQTKSKEEFNNTPKNRFPGRDNGHEGAGIKLPKPDKTEEHTINKEGYIKVGKRIKTIIEFVDNPIQVIKHLIYKYRAPDGTIVWADADLPYGIYGKNLQALNCLLRGKLGASYENIAELVKAFRNDISFCAATSSNLVDKTAKSLTSLREEILEAIRINLYCHSDDTGFRHDGADGYVWVFCTPKYVLYETDLSRSRDVPKRVLGEDYDNYLIVDGWPGYNGYKKQRCWVKLIREVRDLAKEHDEARIHADYLLNMYKEALKTKNKPPDERIEFAKKMNGKMQLGYTVSALSLIPGCSEFAIKLDNARPYLFTGVIHPEIPLDNNYAERKLRRVVIHRKLMGCIRNHKGKRFIENIMSLIETWKIQGKNVYLNLIKYAT